MDPIRRNSTRRKIVKPSIGRRFETFLGSGKKQYINRVRTDEEESGGSTSRLVVRCVVVFMIIQVIIVGGILARGYILKSGEHTGLEDTSIIQAGLLPNNQGNNSAPAPQATPQNGNAGANNSVAQNTPPLNLPQPDGSRNTPDQPVTLTDTPSPTEPVLGPGMAQGNTPAPNTGASTPAVSQNTPQPQTPVSPPPAARRSTVTHLVMSSDTWESIAEDNKCPLADLKAVNPGVVLRSGIYVQIPLPDGVVDSVVVDDVASGQTYTIKSGDTLIQIARAHNTTVKKIMTINNLTEADTRRLKIGQKIKLP